MHAPPAALAACCAVPWVASGCARCTRYARRSLQGQSLAGFSKQSERSERSERSKKGEQRPMGPRIRTQPPQSEAKSVQWDPELERNPHRRCRVDCVQAESRSSLPTLPAGSLRCWVAGSLGRWVTGAMGRWGDGALVVGRWPLGAVCWLLVAGHLSPGVGRWVAPRRASLLGAPEPPPPPLP